MSASSIRGARFPKLTALPQGLADLSPDEQQRFWQSFYASLWRELRGLYSLIQSSVPTISYSTTYETAGAGTHTWSAGSVGAWVTVIGGGGAGGGRSGSGTNGAGGKG